MSPGNGIYDAMMYTYALSLLFVFSDCIRRNATAKRTGTGLLVAVLVLQLAYLGVRTWTDEHLPFLITYDFLFLVSCLLVALSLIMARFQRSEMVVLLLNLIGCTIVVLNKLWFRPVDDPLSTWQTVHGFLILHIVLANLSFAALTVGAVFAALYLFLHHNLKGKRWSDTLRRLPSLEVLDRYTHTSLLIGTPLLMVSVFVAVISIVAEGRWFLLLDSKVIATSAAMCLYIVFLLVRRFKSPSGVINARLALIGYGFMILNFVVNSWSAFHQWTGE
ncbi:cytochrome c biogenesis protein CcsA [Paenibacillus massiliensis]|uniref:cytochrome c biogenesis protein CcsA n=1 Tax=Paenibacillus massiliensis TaxID=225917 RepID=UPI000406DFA0|nr:cytochrome c biogenesis protein CcsA [Paenibacillus massiliensis]